MRLGSGFARRCALAFCVVVAGLLGQSSAASAACPSSSDEYRSSVLATPGLAAYWRLDEATGTQACDTKGVAHGTYGGGSLQGQAGATMGGNAASSFDGSTGKVEVPSSLVLAPASAVTVEAWVYTSTIDSSRKQTIVAKDGSYLLRLSGNNVYWRTHMATGTSWYSLTASGVVRAQEWHHIAATYDGRVMRVFVNGEEITSRVLPGSSMPMPSADSLRLGQGIDSETPAWLSGRIDEVAIYGRALSASELTAHADAATPETQITDAPPAFSNSLSESFSFVSPDSVSGFECSIDDGTWVACSSPKAYEDLREGRHDFKVRAIKSGEIRDVTPSHHTWRVEPLGLRVPHTLHSYGAELRWAASDSASFSSYEIHRGTSASFTPSASTMLAKFTDQQVTSFTDTTAKASATFTYKLLVNGAAAGGPQTVTLPADGQAVSTLQPGPEDGRAAPLWEYEGCRNFGASENATVGQDSGRARFLVGFDLRHIPAEATVQSATLSISAYASPDVSLTVRAHRATAAWEEGDDSRPRCGKGVSWPEAAPAVSWQTAGGDFDAAAVDEVTRSRGSGGWDAFNVTSLVRGWVRGDYPNHGVLFKVPDDVNATSHVDYRTDDYPWNKEVRPKLIVTYTDGAAAVKPSVGITSPAQGSQVSGSTKLTAEAGDDGRIENVEFLVDGTVIGSDNTAPYDRTWNTTTASRGSHSLTARAVDDAGNVTTSAAVTVTVDNSTPPTVSITDPPASYSATVLADSPAVFWRLGETTGTTAADASGNNRTGTYAGTFTLNRPSLITGDPNPAVTFTKATSNGRVSSSGLTGQLGSTVTAEAWIDYSAIPSGTADNYVLSRGWGSVGGWKLIVYRNGSGVQMAGFALVDSQGISKYATASVTPGRLHLAGTYDGTTMRAYVNGAQIAATPVTAPVLNSTSTLFAGNSLNTSIVADEAALYGSALSATQIARHHAAGAGVKGSQTITATASDDLGVDRVEFLLDGNLVGDDTTAPYSMTLNTLSPTAPVADGKHSLTARAIDTSGNATSSAAQDLWVTNAGDSKYATTLTSTSPPAAMIYDPAGGATQEKAGFDVTIANIGRQTVAAASTTLRYRWIAADGSVAATGAGVALGGDIAPGATRTVSGVLVAPPVLPDGVDRGDYTLRFDLHDTPANVWFSDKGAKPLEHRVVVNRANIVGLGLERFYQYDGAPLGAGMGHLVNLASGNSIVRWSPWEAPGRGISTLLDLTYNSLEDHSRSPAGNNVSLSISSLVRFGSQLDIHPNKADEIAGNAKRYAEIVDGDGTLHRFTGQQAADGSVFWVEPTGVHLHMRRHSTSDPKRAWAISRPDRTTFFFDEEGYPTYAVDGNQRGLTFTLEDTPPGEDPGGPKKRITAVTDDGGRSFGVSYYSKADGVKAHVRGKIKSISDHTGSKLDFTYYDDGNLLRLIQRGGPSPDGTQVADRSFTFSYTEPSTSNPAAANPADPNPKTPSQSTRLYGVRDPRGSMTTFSYLPTSAGADRYKLASRTDRDSDRVDFAYDRVARRTTVTAPLGRVSKYDFDADGKATKLIDPENRTTLIEWVDRHVTKVTEPSQSGTTVTTRYSYDRNGYLTEQTDQLGRKTVLTYEYPDHLPGDVPGRWGAGRTHGHISDLAAVTDPKGVLSPASGDYQWSFDNDSAGNPTVATDPLGRSTVNSYAPNGDLLKIVDARGNETAFENYDQNGLPQTIRHAGADVDANDRITRFGYSADGLLEWIQDPVHANATGADPSWYRSYLRYDAFHRLAQQSQPKSTVLQPGVLLYSDTGYDANDNVVTAFAPHEGAVKTSGHKTATDYDPMDRPVKVTGPTAGDGRLTPEEAADYRLRVTSMDYDAAGRMTRMTTPRGSETPANLNDSAVQYDYDLLDRVVRTKRVNDQGAAVIEHACYDPAGNLASITGPRAELATVSCPAASGTPYTSRFTYFADHQPNVRTDAEGRTTSVAYDDNGDPVTMTDQRGKQMRLEYDQLRRVVRERRQLDSTNFAVTQFEYDEVGNRVRVASPRAWDTAPDLTSYAGRDFVTTTTFDEFDEPVRTQLGDLTDYVHRGFDVNGRMTFTSLPISSSSMPLVDGDPDPANASTYSHFDTGWIRTSRNPGQRTTRFDYWPEGWQKERAPSISQGGPDDPAEVEDSDHRTMWRYYPDGTLREKASRDGQMTHYVYDANANLISSTEQQGNNSVRAGLMQTAASYDNLDRLVEVRDRLVPQNAISQPPPWKVSTYSHFLDGSVSEQIENARRSDGGTTTDAGRRATFAYDQTVRLLVFRDFGKDGDATDDRITDYAYAPTGWPERRRVAKFNGSGDPFSTANPQILDTRWRYLDNGLVNGLTTRDDTEAIVEDHTIDYREGGVFVNGNPVKDTFTQKRAGGSGPCDAAGCFTSWTYDKRDRLNVETRKRVDTITTDYDPLANGSVGKITTTSTRPGLQPTVQEFDYQGVRLTESRVEVSGTLLADKTRRYFHDLRGNVECVTDGVGSRDDSQKACDAFQTSASESVDHLIEHKTYDDLDRLTAHRSYDQANQFAPVKSTEYDYDALDRPIWEQERHGSDGLGEGSRTTTFDYFGLSRDVSEEVRDPLAGAQGTRRTKNYAYDSDGTRIGLTDTVHNSDNTKTVRSYAYGHNPQGSVSLLLGGNGKIQASYGYTAYGETDGDSTDPNSLTKEIDPAKVNDGDANANDTFNPYRYTAKRSDTGSGTIDMGARHYSPSTTSFVQHDFYESALGDLGLTQDPLNSNRYSLAGGNPVSFVESDGHMIIDGPLRRGTGTSGSGTTRSDPSADSGSGSGSSAGGQVQTDGDSSAAKPAASLGLPCAPGSCGDDQANNYATRYVNEELGPLSGQAVHAILTEGPELYEDADAESFNRLLAYGDFSAVGHDSPGVGDLLLNVTPIKLGLFKQGAQAVGRIGRGLFGGGSRGGVGAGDDALRTVSALTRQQDVAVSATLRDPNKLRHIFEKPQHNLGGLTQALGGREAVVREAVLAVPRSTIGTFEVAKQIGIYNLTVRGRVVDGVPRIGTVFVP